MESSFYSTYFEYLYIIVYSAVFNYNYYLINVNRLWGKAFKLYRNCTSGDELMMSSRAKKIGLFIIIVVIFFVGFYLGTSFSSSEKDKLTDEINEKNLIIDKQEQDILEMKSLIKKLENNVTIKDDEIDRLQGEKEALHIQIDSLQETIIQKDANISFLKQQNTNLQLVNYVNYAIYLVFGMGLVEILKILRWAWHKYKQKKKKYPKKETKGPEEMAAENEELISQRRTLDIEQYIKK